MTDRFMTTYERNYLARTYYLISVQPSDQQQDTWAVFVPLRDTELACGRVTATDLIQLSRAPHLAVVWRATCRRWRPLRRKSQHSKGT
ncbi:hypothetical protein FKR81_16655 [Lentzea tibetensis]|uniref:Uncharacterized protein n=1 Tax=Lentzea tibetensis TaxID=2591470 RepID=A0A563EUB2_9PSEU|nr:hypothetical protein [Lentzea tibetensis]TWP51243.1 hypothetical protein FKR81_16655 [Lentzea tibetensis]